MAFTSVFAIAVMLIILGIFMMIIVNINTAAEVVKQDYNNIEIFFKDSVKTDDILNSWRFSYLISEEKKRLAEEENYKAFHSFDLQLKKMSERKQ